MIKLNRLLRRTAVRLLCLVAALIALSPSARADWGTPGLLGEGYSNATWTSGSADYNNWTSDNGWYKKTIKASGTVVKFRIRCWDGNDNREYQPQSNSGNTTVTNGTTYSTWGIGSSETKTSTFQINSENDKEYTIWFKTGTTDNNVKVTWDTGSSTDIEYYLKGDFNGWGDLKFTKGADNVYTCKVESWDTSKNKFKVHTSEDKWYGPSGDNDTNLSTNYTSVSGDGKNFLIPTAENGKDVTFYLEPISNGIKLRYSASWDLNAYYIYYGEPNQSWENIKMKKLGDNLWGGSFTPGAKDEFKIRKATNNNGENLFGSSASVSNGVTFTVATTDNSTIKLSNNTAHATTSVMFYPKSNKVTCTWKDLTKDPFSNINTEYPVVYLLGNVINGERPSPEWIMKKVGDNKYELEFTARDSKMTVWAGGDNDWKNYGFYARKYDSKTSNGSNVGSWNNENNSMFDWKYVKRVTKDDNGKEVKSAVDDLYPGRRYKATLDNNTLKIEPLDGEKNYPPYMSLVGYHFKQTDGYLTPMGLDGIKIGTTNASGWQDAWLQFGKDGKPLKDRLGNVAYNTMWPPKNPVYFYIQPDESGEYIEISSATLQMKPETDASGKPLIKTGSDWKNYGEGDHPISGNTVSGKEYYNLFNDNYNGGVGQKQHLRDKSKYVRYVANNVWILGSAKIWTGWGGTNTENADNIANWSNHANWGIAKVYDNDGGTEITGQEPWNLKAEAGNFSFKEPTYFGTVEVFYCVDKNGDTFGDTFEGTNANEYGAMYDGCIFYTTKAKGDAQILARNDDQNEKSYYKFSANYEGHKVKKYRIFRRNVVAEGDGSEPVYCDKAGNPCDREKSLVEEDLTLDQDTKAFSAEHGEYNEKEQMEPDLAEGRYRYEMDIEFDDESTANVQSPVVTILNKLTTVIEMAQLIKVENNSVKDSKGDPYDYITFPKNDDDLVYGIKQSAGGIYCSGGVSVYESLGKKRSEMAEVYKYSEKSSFTDNVILTSEYPKLSGSLTTEKPVVTIYTVFGAEGNFGVDSDQSSWSKENAPLTADGNTIAICYTKSVGTVDDVSLRLSYSYTIDGETHSKETTPVPNTIYLTVPEPKFVKGEIDMKTDYEAKDGFKYNGFDLGTANYQTMHEYVTIEEPNATEELKLKMDDKSSGLGFTYRVDGKPIAFDCAKDGNNVYKADARHPSEFTGRYNGVVECVIVNTANIPLYDRWKDGEIKSVVLTDDAPNTMSASLQNYTLSWKDVEGGTHLIEDFWIKLQDGGNNVDNGIKENDSLRTEFNHHADNDWYYVTLHEYDPVSKTTNPKMDVDGTQAFVFSVADFKNSSDVSGARIHVRKDHGHWYENIESALSYTKLSNNLRIRVSHLYPFDVPEQTSGMPGMERTAANYGASTNVLKSKGVELKNETPTSVGGVFDGMDSGSVKAGVGFIEVSGDGVEIYNASGVAVASGEGRHEVPSGVYVVRLNGRAEKVIVR